MFNLLKWNITDYIKKNTWILIGIAASLLFAALPRNSVGLLNNLLIGLASISGLILFQAGILTSFLFAFRWAENSSVELELSLPVSSHKQIAVKLLTGALVNFLSLIFLLQLFLLIGRFSSGSYQWITGEHLRGVLGWVVFLTFLEGSVLFAYIFSHSYRITRRAPDLFTALVSLALIGTVVICTVLIMAVTDQLIAPTFSTNSILTVEGNLQILSFTLPNWVFLSFILLEWLAGSRLLQNRFQKN
jgi:hypothetical protein